LQQLTQMDQLALFHRKLISNSMEFNNLRNLLISQIKKSLMITRTDTTLTRNQIQVLILKLNLIQTLLLEKPVEITKKQMKLTFPESHISLKLSTEMQLWEKSLTDGKETQTTLDQPNFQPHNLLTKRKRIQTQPSEKQVTITKKSTKLTYLVNQISFSI